jgi:hypothetical protein
MIQNLPTDWKGLFMFLSFPWGLVIVYRRQWVLAIMPDGTNAFRYFTFGRTQESSVDFSYRVSEQSVSLPLVSDREGRVLLEELAHRTQIGPYRVFAYRPYGESSLVLILCRPDMYEWLFLVVVLDRSRTGQPQVVIERRPTLVLHNIPDTPNALDAISDGIVRLLSNSIPSPQLPTHHRNRYSIVGFGDRISAAWERLKQCLCSLRKIRFRR